MEEHKMLMLRLPIAFSAERSLRKHINTYFFSPNEEKMYLITCKTSHKT